MIKDIVEVLHETTIAASVVTFYIDLFHLDSLLSPLGVQYVSELLQEYAKREVVMTLATMI